MIRLAPRLKAATVDLIRGVSLDLEAPEPRTYEVAMRDARDRVVAARMRDETLDDLALAAITMEALAAHLVIGWHGVEDEDGAPVPFSIEAWRALVALDPRLVSYARTAFDKHLLAAEQAVREGNGSPPSASGAQGAA